jgi:ABC-2 type transport system permease protein
LDRLIALVLLRWRLDLRGLGFARERAVALLVTLPVLAAFSLGGAALLFLGVRAVAAGEPALLLPALSAAATLVGLFWMASPLLSGLALTESHDLGRLLHFPIPALVLAASSLVANLSQPMVLAELPMAFAVAAALAGGATTLPLALAGVLLSFATIVAASHASALLLHGLARRRRWQDLSLFLGIGLGFAISLLPMALLVTGGRPLVAAARLLRGADVFALSPFAWGARAAVLGGRGDVAGFALWSLLAAGAIAGALTLSGVLVHRLHRGELDLGEPRASSRGRARMRLPGEVGALVEKDLRTAWRDPAMKAALVMGLVMPTVLALFFARGMLRGPGILYLATLVGISATGNNAFGFERRGLALLMGFPVERWKVLAGKNAGAAFFRLPGLVVVALAALLVGPAAQLPAALAIAVATMLIASGLDNYSSILMPVVHPAPGSNPYPARGRGRGLGGVLLSFLQLGFTLLLSLPFAFLGWMPSLFGAPWLAWLTLPLAVAGAASVYAMLLAGAARLLERRETELLERILGEA